MTTAWRAVRVFTPVAAMALAGVAALAPSAQAAPAAIQLSLRSGAAITAPVQVTAGQARLLGAAPASQPLRLVLGLTRPHAAEEDAFVASLKDKKSPNYRHFLTASQWNARFSPSAKAEGQVVAWAKSQGLTVSHRYANRLLVDVDSTVGAVEKAFSLKINNYRIGTTDFYSNDRSVALPASLAGVVQNVAGLNSYQTLKPANTTSQTPQVHYSAGPVRALGAAGHANGSKTKLAAAMKVSRAKLARARTTDGPTPGVTGGFYDPTDIYSSQAYGVDGLNGQGHCCNPTHAANVTPAATSIAIANSGSEATSDMQAFQSRYSYLAYHFQEFNIDGTPTCCSGEGTMDLEWSTTMANSFGSFVDTAMVYMYNAPNSQFGTFDDIWNHMLSDNLARTMSTDDLNRTLHKKNNFPCINIIK